MPPITLRSLKPFGAITTTPGISSIDLFSVCAIAWATQATLSRTCAVLGTGCVVRWKFDEAIHLV
jgi:hypothetical protein